MLRKSELDNDMLKKEIDNLQFNIDKAEANINKLLIKRENI